jgi:hypothetical protein
LGEAPSKGGVEMPIENENVGEKIDFVGIEMQLICAHPTD